MTVEATRLEVVLLVRRRPRNFTGLPTLRRGDRLCWLPRPSRSWPSSIRCKKFLEYIIPFGCQVTSRAGQWEIQNL